MHVMYFLSMGCSLDNTLVFRKTARMYLRESEHRWYKGHTRANDQASGDVKTGTTRMESNRYPGRKERRLVRDRDLRFEGGWHVARISDDRRLRPTTEKMDV